MNRKTFFIRSFFLLPALAGIMALGFLPVQSQAGEGWLTDFEAAKAKAAAEGKPLLLDFTGSDWCGWCIKLDDEVFSQEAFKSYASESLVLVELDFPKRGEQSEALKAQNQALAEKYRIRGFPTIVLLTPEGELIEKTGYRRGGAPAYVEHLKDLTRRI